MSQALDKNGLRFAPMNIDEDNWYYEERRGIVIVHQHRDSEGNIVSGSQITIPWRKLRASLNRYDKGSKP
jgi:hypothetical protein